ncbi:cysteine desulfurase family protein [Tardiphaga alba]|uniref:cysteine desulfurase family protein n=1 Tax=Tardiphaga alba TaxID=340268 RepID=UPI0020133CA7|nr:cysteine desulfurase family protein [Tardiphaga alba]
MARPRVYLDWNATTPLRDEARVAMLAAMDTVGNPSSVHAEGRQARRLVEDARAAVAAAVGAEARQVVFTSGGTEANVMALVPGIGRKGSAPVQRLIVSAVEHPSVMAAGRFPSEAATVVAVDRNGVVDPAHLRSMLAGGSPALVSVMLANNETGALQPIVDIAHVIHEAGGLLHVDAVQALGKIPLNINELQIDLLSISAHKIGGPKGVGALVVGDRLAGPEPLLRGGGQELSRRAGTENVIGIAGFGAAAKVATAGLAQAADIAKLREKLESGLRQHNDVIVFAADAPRLPNTILFGAPGLRAETAVIGFDLEGIAVSSGSACSSGKVQPSHVIEAMGYGPELTRSAIRLSLGWSTTHEDVELCLQAWKKLAGSLIKQSDETEVERF